MTNVARRVLYRTRAMGHWLIEGFPRKKTFAGDKFVRRDILMGQRKYSMIKKVMILVKYYLTELFCALHFEVTLEREREPGYFRTVLAKHIFNNIISLKL